jgi:hypothetical protein
MLEPLPPKCEPDPDGPPAPEPPVPFRCSVWPLFFVTAAWGVTIATAIALGAMFLVGQRLDRQRLFALMAGIAGGEVTGLVLCYVLARHLVKIRVSPAGLRCSNFWGLYRTTAWDDILSARPCNFLGLRFLRTHTANALTPLWVPLFLTEQERFAALVCRHAGVTNPLARALDESA